VAIWCLVESGETVRPSSGRTQRIHLLGHNGLQPGDIVDITPSTARQARKGNADHLKVREDVVDMGGINMHGPPGQADELVIEKCGVGGGVGREYELCVQDY
jgi:hypothetical protein